ncbi:hypothetical protein AQI88_17960 [Streptomyces cellostaticus]|uniref:Regulatory protein n=1 Tax=Streptomyces cellostaticus TaxID=67285 RepID=A0A101NL58_9ACTN|nr:BlaI/MecI/CopY family transcriptional regulator [Streptomyces cellostaticus]KUM95274.1 hypothetical protein AQI88_17960 [Streptomyces cellostaticus]GHI02066.1 hypothetical protein Scel_03870 [Streptomyces cellostaticus]
MSETTTAATELASQYSTQVAGDLERNLKEQERLSGAIQALQQQLASLQQDHTVLLSIQQALGTPAVPAPRKKAAAKPVAGKQAIAKKAPAPARKGAGRKSAATAPASPTALPTLVDLAREHLAGQNEPRSAAEVTTALAQQHPERTIRTTVVRTTLEGLVAKNQAQRSKQGTSVFYTASVTAEPTTRAEESSESA